MKQSEPINYYANGFTYKLEQGNDGWWSIFRYNEDTGEYDKTIQARDIDHAKSWCDLCERSPITLLKLC